MPTNSLGFFFFLQRIRDLEDKTDIQKRQIKDLEEKVCVQYEFQSLRFRSENNRSFTRCVSFLLSYCVSCPGRCSDSMTLTARQAPALQQRFCLQQPRLDMFAFCVDSCSFLRMFSFFSFPFLTFISFLKLHFEFCDSTLLFLLKIFFDSFLGKKKTILVILHKKPFLPKLQCPLDSKSKNLGWHMVIMPSCHFPQWPERVLQVNQHFQG